jgi:hypothetical protein
LSNSRCVDKSPHPLFSKEGLKRSKKIPPLAKGSCEKIAAKNC